MQSANSLTAALRPQVSIILFCISGKDPLIITIAGIEDHFAVIIAIIGIDGIMEATMTTLISITLIVTIVVDVHISTVLAVETMSDLHIRLKLVRKTRIFP